MRVNLQGIRRRGGGCWWLNGLVRLGNGRVQEWGVWWYNVGLWFSSPPVVRWTQREMTVDYNGSRGYICASRQWIREMLLSFLITSCDTPLLSSARTADRWQNTKKCFPANFITERSNGRIKIIIYFCSVTTIFITNILFYEYRTLSETLHYLSIQ